MVAVVGALSALSLYKCDDKISPAALQGTKDLAKVVKGQIVVSVGLHI
jgi:hypothetical protein